MPSRFTELRAGLQRWRERLRARGNATRVPTVLQMEAVECGAASLAMVLAHHGRILPLEELRIACNVTRDGTSASNVVRAARDYGLKAKGFRKQPQQLRDLPMPAIIHWNFNHFLVLEGFRGERVYLNDPAQGRYAVTPAELDESFTGVVLAFEPGPDFRRAREKPGLIASLAPRLANSRRDLAYLLLASLGLVVPALVVPAFTKIYIDQFLINRMADWVPLLLVAMTAMMGVSALLTWLQQRVLLRLETRLSLVSSSKFLWHLLHLPIEFFSQRFGGEVGARVAINDRVARLLSGDLAGIMLSLLTLVFYLLLMLCYDVALTLVTAAIAGINFAVLRLLAGQRRDASRRLQQEGGKLLGTTLSGIVAAETLKSTGGEADFYARWVGYFAKMVNAEQQLGLTDRVVGAMPTLLLSLNTAAVLGLGSLRAMDGALTVGGIVAFYYLMQSALVPVNRLVQIGALLQAAEADVSRVDDVLRYRTAPAGAESADAGKLSGAMELKDVSFGYSRLAPALIESFSLSIAPGSRVALVGGSGSGKSTLGRLVCGLHQPWSGQVLFDQRGRTEWSRSALTSSLAYVDQEIVVFEGSVRDNLSLWDGTLREAELVRAAKDACIHDDIMARVGGYDGVVAEGGGNFSGGQLQRLEIARALAQSPSLLVLDEATSALDAHTEMQLVENLRRRGCACLIVSHRLSAVRDCDEIIVLRFGRVVERGTHESLMAAGGHYAELVSSA